MNKLLTFCTIVAFMSCTNEDMTRKTLEAQGFTNIVTDGWSPTQCSNNDSTCTSFHATSPTGDLVEGAVGCGRQFGGCGKGCTVRLR